MAVIYTSIQYIRIQKNCYAQTIFINATIINIKYTNNSVVIINIGRISVSMIVERGIMGISCARFGSRVLHIPFSVATDLQTLTEKLGRHLHSMHSSDLRELLLLSQKN